MSRIGKQPIALPAGVEATIREGEVSIKGPKGTLTLRIHPHMSVGKKEGAITVVPVKRVKDTPKLWGTTRALLANMVRGVVEGYEKRLEIEGIGYRAEMKGNNLLLQLGFSHPVEFPAPSGIQFKIEKNTIIVSGIAKEAVGEAAASIRALRKPEPYKGKGIHYVGEVIRRKAGKKATASA